MNTKKLNEEIEKLVEAEDSIQPVYDEVTHPEMDLDVIILTALKNCNADDPDLQKELENSSLAEVVYPNLKELSVEELKAIMEHHREFTGNHDNSLYPSEWPADKFGPYPVKLAKALVLTDDNESITDVYNIFYSNRQVDEAAAAVFMQDALKDPKEVTKKVLVDTMQEYDPDFVTEMLEEIAEKYPQFVEEIKAKFNI